MDIASACLAGHKCRFDGTAKPCGEIIQMVFNKELAVFCPEALAGLSGPRPPSEITGGDGAEVLKGNAKVLTRDGTDVSVLFIAGAKRALELCLRHGAKKVYLKTKSPSCGAGKIFDGSFSGRLIPGDGVTAALLRQNGIEIIPID